MVAKSRGLGLVRASVVVLALGLTGPTGDRRVQAQGLTPDPYNIVGEYNGQYAPYMYAVEPTPGSVFPNMARLQGRTGVRSANRFQNYTDSLDGVGADDDGDGTIAPPRIPGLGNPYYRAFRRYDKEFDRVYRPNKDADASYNRSVTERNTTYFKALRERDPKKRAQLLRRYNLEKLLAARDLSTNRRNAPEREPAEGAPEPPGRGARTPGMGAAPPAPRALNPAPAAADRATAPAASTTARSSRPAPRADVKPAEDSPEEILKRSERALRGESVRSRAPAPPRGTRSSAR